MKDVLPVLLKEKQSLNSNEFDDPALLQQLHSSSDSISYNLGHETKQVFVFIYFLYLVFYINFYS